MTLWAFIFREARKKTCLFVIPCFHCAGRPEEVFKGTAQIRWHDPWPANSRPFDSAAYGFWDHVRPASSSWKQLHPQVSHTMIQKQIKVSVLGRQDCVYQKMIFFFKMFCHFHSDLALRNCLLTSDLTVRIGDYGLSHNHYKVSGSLTWFLFISMCATLFILTLTLLEMYKSFFLKNKTKKKTRFNLYA